MGLFPDLFNQSFPFPSFDVWDLHSVDQGVITHLFPYLNAPIPDSLSIYLPNNTFKDNSKDKEKHATDWDLLVGHFLGVDHAGHRFGPE